MGSKPITSTPANSTRKLRRKSSNSRSSKRRLCKTEYRPRSAAHVDGGSSVSDKLEALKNLIPSENADMKSDELFQETADYIVLLETQVLVLQKLINFYGSQPQENENENENVV